MDKIARIRQEIERLKEDYLNRSYTFVPVAMVQLLEFMDTLSDEPDKSLEEAAEKHINEALFKWSYDDEDGIEQYVHDSFIAGAEWQKKRFEAEYELDWITDLKKDLYELGRKDEREQMLKEAVEADVNTYEDLVAGKSWAEFVVEMPTNNLGDKVRIIIVKEENK